MIAFQSQMTPQRRAAWYAAGNKVLIAMLVFMGTLSVLHLFPASINYTLQILFCLAVVLRDALLWEARTGRAQLLRVSSIVLIIAGVAGCILYIVQY